MLTVDPSSETHPWLTVIAEQSKTTGIAQAFSLSRDLNLTIYSAP
jgi:hypothetical protein